MLTHSQLEKLRKFDLQYGPPEDSFSPRWHEQNPAGETAVSSIAQTTSKVVKLTLVHAENKETGDIALIKIDAPLPEEYSFVPNPNLLLPTS